MVILGKTNMDEFAMGSLHRELRATARRTTRGTSTGSPAGPAAARPPRSPRTRRRWPSAPTPAARSASRRAVTGIVGAKPTYGGVVPVRPGRVRVVARHAGPVRPHGAGRRAAARGHRRARPAATPPRIHAPVPPVVAAARQADVSRAADRRGQRVRRRGLPAGRAGSASTRRSTCSTSLGAEIVEVSCPHFEYALPAYYLIAPSECSSNLARFDAMRYGLRVGDDGIAQRRGGHVADPRRPGSAPRSSAGSSSAPTRCPPATTTPTTARRRRSAP